MVTFSYIRHMPDCVIAVPLLLQGICGCVFPAKACCPSSSRTWCWLTYHCFFFHPATTAGTLTTYLFKVYYFYKLYYLDVSCNQNQNNLYSWMPGPPSYIYAKILPNQNSNLLFFFFYGLYKLFICNCLKCPQYDIQQSSC